MNIPYITGAFIEEHTDYKELVAHLKNGFKQNKTEVPLRSHFEIESDPSGTLLVMPAWQVDQSIGVKLINVFPENKDLPSINGLYIHFDGKTGQPLCIIDAKSLTNKRTAAASALASSLLSRVDSNSLLMLGTGTLAPELIRAHAAVRPITKVYVWGRNFAKAQRLCDDLKDYTFQCLALADYKSVMSEVDIVSSATMAQHPIIPGDLIMPGQHVDLVGSYKPSMREADDDVIRKCKIYVDTMEGATKESGDICIPIAEGVITKQSIKAEFNGMCQDDFVGRTDSEETTLFKSVGYALEDLVAGTYYWNQLKNADS